MQYITHSTTHVQSDSHTHTDTHTQTHTHTQQICVPEPFSGILHICLRSDGKGRPYRWSMAALLETIPPAPVKRCVAALGRGQSTHTTGVREVEPHRRTLVISSCSRRAGKRLVVSSVQLAQRESHTHVCVCECLHVCVCVCVCVCV